MTPRVAIETPVARRALRMPLGRNAIGGAGAAERDAESGEKRAVHEEHGEVQPRGRGEWGEPQGEIGDRADGDGDRDTEENGSNECSAGDRYFARGHAVCPIGAARGSLKPTRIVQRNPGKQVSGISGRNLMLSISNQLSSPQTAMAIPNHISQRGMRCVSPAVTAMPAMNMPKGTEKPGPPMPNEIR